MQTSLEIEEKEGLKLTKYGWLPDDWKLIRLADVGDFKNGINKSKDDFGHGVPFINLLDVFGKSVIEAQDFALVNATDKEQELYSLKKGDVLFIRSSVKPDGVGLTSLIDSDLANTVYSGFIIRYRTNKNVFYHDFKKYCFYGDKFRNQLLIRSSISANTNINQESLRQLYIPLPPLSEQRTIASILSTWDKGIDKLQQLITAKQKRKRALMQQLLTGKIRFQEFVEEWQEVRLGDVLKERIETNRSDLKLLSITSSGGIVDRDTLEKRDTSNEDKGKYRRIAPGDIGYNTMRLWQGVAALSELEGIVSPAYTIVIPQDAVEARFMSYLFKLPQMIHTFYRHSQGLVDDTRNCKYNHFAKIKVILPNKAEQIKIASALQTADKEIETLQQKLDALKLQKKGLMQKLLTGQVRVNLKPEPLS
ncbi:restriction endonuclease subunit S [uncultured Pontibacter sp.]|uniref:restriction endonuclease subunit S n=1 Tax=uncultured Pontibacter sp. TaxID=453356 RepID=UPI0026090565|nr:restriction endonuclease subunit S [uncultured Pontibacter sp.]